MKKLFIALAISIVLISCFCLNISAKTFSDVPADAWYAEAVSYCADRGYVAGTSDTTFSPKMVVTRAMPVRILANMAEYVEEDFTTTSFADVDVTAWYATSVEWAATRNVVTGNNGNFMPKKNVTREQLVQMLYTFAQFTCVDVSDTSNTAINSFADAKDVSSWATPAMNWAVENGIISGSNNKLMPKNGATRAQLVTVIKGFCDKYMALAETVKLSNAITDDMMLQRDEKVSIWGFANSYEEGKLVKVQINGYTAFGRVNNGEWKASFYETFPASADPTTVNVITLDGGLEVKNILFGDVYYVIGQSNVHYSMADLITDTGSFGMKVDYDFDTSRNIRFFRNSNTYHHANTGDRAPGTATLYKDAEVPKGWQTAGEVGLDFEMYRDAFDKANHIFSALGYLMAWNMSNETDVPIGVIEIDASGFPLIAFAPNELAEKWGHEAVNDLGDKDPSNDIHFYHLNNSFSFEGNDYPGGVANALLTSRMAYNQQIYPLINFSTAGIVWYQGESDWANTEETQGFNNNTFRYQFTELMTYYREHMGNNDFPVYLVEFPSCFPVASGAYISTGTVRAELGTIPQILDNSYVVSSSDFFSNTSWQNNIHPYIKHYQAQRLAGIVLGNQRYAQHAGYKDVNYTSGPVLRASDYVDANTVKLYFDYVADGLTVCDESDEGIKGIEVKINGVWVSVPHTNVKISGKDELTVTYAEGEITGVRYNAYTSAMFWGDVTLGNSEEIPAVAFVDYNRK